MEFSGEGLGPEQIVETLVVVGPPRDAGRKREEGASFSGGAGRKTLFGLLAPGSPQHLDRPLAFDLARVISLMTFCCVLKERVTDPAEEVAPKAHGRVESSCCCCCCLTLSASLFETRVSREGEKKKKKKKREQVERKQQPAAPAPPPLLLSSWLHLGSLTQPLPLLTGIGGKKNTRNENENNSSPPPRRSREEVEKK